VIGRRAARAAVPHDEAPEYWIAYSDLLVSLLMVFALLLFLTLSKMQSDVKVAKETVDATNAAVQAAVAGLGGSGGMHVRFDPRTQALGIPSEVLFATDSATLRPASDQAVREIARGFFQRLLTDPQAVSRIESIVVEGHTDTTGSYLYNLDLSQRRSQAVMRSIVTATESEPWAAKLQELLVASGRSEVEALRAVDARTYEAAKARRILLRVRFRNDDLLAQIFGRFSSPGVR
jgi:chemotaxis protein MotB